MPGEELEQSPMLAMHRECALRSILGSEAHHLGRCSCFGGSESDRPDVSRRDAARYALIAFMAVSGSHCPFRRWPVMQRVKIRPSDFGVLPAEEQWRVDRALNLLDWDGKGLH